MFQKCYRLVLLLSVLCVDTPWARATPQTAGQWSDLYPWPIMAVHCAVLPDGNILCVTEEEATVTTCTSGDPPEIDQEKRVVIFDPAANTVHCLKEPGEPGVYYNDPNQCSINQPGLCKAHLFCSGHTHLADGRIAFFGGQGTGQNTGQDKGYDSSHDRSIIYDYTVSEEAARWSVADVMPSGVYNSGKRYYPTATALGDGSHLVMAGNTPVVPWLPHPYPPNIPPPDADTPVVFTPFHASDSQYEALAAATQYMNWYPFNFLISDGTLLSVGGHYFGAQLNPTANPPASNPVPTMKLNISTQTWSEVTTCPIKGGSAVMYRPDKIMKAGGGLDSSASCNATNDPTTNRAFVLDATQSNPTWNEIDTLNYARVHHILVTLPNGEVMALGGSPATSPTVGCYGAAPVPEIINPDETTPSWRMMAPANSGAPRYYHSVGLLLPDGRVLSAGGENSGEGFFTPYLNAQIFSPPYLFDFSGNLAARPTIVSVTGMGANKMKYGQIGSVKTSSAAEATNIGEISFLRLGSMTHSFDHDARFMWLNFTVDPQNTDTLLVTAPATGNHAPPGHYMMFILDEGGVPSVAKIVQIGADCNNNNVFDFDDLMAGTLTDCNHNRVPDACESASCPSQALYYVNVAAAAGGNGLTWATAFNNLQAAITGAAPNDRIMVQSGDYPPVALKNGVAVYGGFVGNETSLSQADYKLNVTNIIGTPTKAHVVTNLGGGSETILRGFHIKNGNAYGTGGRGGGLYLENSSARFVQCVFTNNDASGNGAGVANLKNGSGVAGSPTFVNCTFHRNKDVNLSGEILKGAGIFSEGGNPTFVNCLIHKNEGRDGAGLYIDGGQATLRNCTISDNTASNQGGGLYDKNGQSVIRNSILAFNTGAVAGDQIFNVSGTTTVTYSAVRGSWPGEGNIVGKNLFVDRFADNYNLVSNSQCIDKGRNTDLPTDGSDIDWDGNIMEPLPKDLAVPNGPPSFPNDARVKKCVNVDMGALEVQVECSLP